MNMLMMHLLIFINRITGAVFGFTDTALIAAGAALNYFSDQVSYSDTA